MSGIVRSCWIGSVVICLAAQAGPAPASRWCEPSPPVAKALDRFDLAMELCADDQRCVARQRAALDELLQRYPDDHFVLRADQDFHRTQSSAAARAERNTFYVKRAEGRPRDAAAWALAGRLQPSLDAARPYFERALELDPRFPWAHLSLVGTLFSKNPEQSKVHLGTFAEICPGAIAEVASLRRMVQDADWAAIASNARAALAGKPLSRRSLAAYPALWALEFRGLAPAEFEGAKVRVRQDLARLEQLKLEDDPGYWRALEEGAKLLGDSGAAEEALASRLKLIPCSDEVAKQRMTQSWQASAQGEAELLTAKTQRAKAQYEEARTWTAKCPRQTVYRMMRLTAALERGDLPIDVVLTELDEALVLRRAQSGSTAVSGFLPALDAASLYVEQRVRLEQVAALADEVRTQADADLTELLAAGLPASFTDRIKDSRDAHVWRVDVLAAKAALALGRREEVRSRLGELETTLASAPSPDGGSPKAAEARQEQSATLWQLKADLAAVEGRELDQLAFALQAAEHAPKRYALGPGVRETWSRLGGTSEGWEALTTTSAAPRSAEAGRSEPEDGAGWRTIERPLPPFALVDLAGRTWTEADLKGKRTLINFWATWCVPCQLEMPLLEKLAAELAGKPDVLLLTLNMDQNPGIVPAFVAAKKMTLPALLAADYVSGTLGNFSIPRNWIVDEAGVVRFEHSGFSPEHAEVWVNESRSLLGTGKPKTGS